MGTLINDWLELLKAEYLRDFIRDGGAAVRFCVIPDEESAFDLRESLRRLAAEEGYTYAFVDASETRVHQVDRIFFEVARQLDWGALAAAFVRSFLTRHGYTLPPSGSLRLSEVAEANQSEEIYFRQRIHADIEVEIHHDYAMSQEFRIAMVQLCLAVLEPEGPVAVRAKLILEWLRGELRLISALKDAMIFQKITRYSARYMLYSLAHWLKFNGTDGLVMVMDIARCLTVRQRGVEQEGLFYSGPALLDAYEVLRQFIDGTDEMEGLLIVVMAPRDFLTDERRGLDRYDALKMRVLDDVRDRYRENPLSAMVRLDRRAVAP